MAEMLEFKFDTQLLIEGHDLDEDEINDYITEHFKGDCLLAVGDDELIKIHFHTIGSGKYRVAIRIATNIDIRTAIK